MSKEISGLRSMLTLQCPSCHQQNMFINEKIYTWKNIGPVKNFCSNCGANLKPETGFYFGAAYVSYGLTVILWVSILVALKVLDYIGVIEFGFLTHPVTFLTTGILFTIILFPYLLRVSRSIWAHFFIKSTRPLTR